MKDRIMTPDKNTRLEKKREYRAKGKNTPEDHGSNVPLGWKPTIASPLPPFRCTGTVKNGDRAGERCNKWAIPGMAESNAKCIKHGGQIPIVKERAQTRLEEARQKLMGLSPTAAEVIEDIMLSGDNDAVRLKAAQDILDRTGILKGQEINLEAKIEDNSASEIKKRLEEMRRSLLQGNGIESVEEVTEDAIEDAELEVDNEDPDELD